MSDSKELYRKVLNDTRNYLRYLMESGLEELPVKRYKTGSHRPHEEPGRGPSPHTGVKWAKPAGMSLESIRKELDGCKRCKLYRKRSNIVFGSGAPDAVLMFIGEAPGEEEDLQGEPFVGKAGQLLTKIITAIGLKREDAYICNIVKCRPPDNRNPEPDEIAVCRQFVESQIDVIKPKVIVALGAHAAQMLLDTTEKITALRGKFHRYRNNIHVMPTFHPAYLLRNENKKKEAWEDMKKVMNILGLTPPVEKR